MDELLHEIAKRCIARGLPLLTAMVVRHHKPEGWGRPGAGFYESARRLGFLCRLKDNEKFWHDQVKAVLAYFMQKRRAA